MSEQSALLKRIVGKIKLLKAQYIEQAEALLEREREVAQLQARLKELENKLNTKNNNSKPLLENSPCPGKKLSIQQRKDIEGLVREIDHCLMLLDDNYQYKEK
ncbi:MAG: hypothetical protein CSA95_06225 [Bacteroidetes bacterium]|nr:MAG: hypothetical protein CSA95_06225 [Bacteroidota bacterium]PIE87881.1 MAG: hypothetical protein CSA04_04745 [Bacteroidota bacterium]